MKYVYILRSINFPDRYYTGIADDLKMRLARHNAKEVPHTSKYAPWQYFAAIAPYLVKPAQMGTLGSILFHYGPPRFALAGYAWRSHALADILGEAVPGIGSLSCSMVQIIR